MPDSYAKFVPGPNIHNYEIRAAYFQWRSQGLNLADIILSLFHIATLLPPLPTIPAFCLDFNFSRAYPGYTPLYTLIIKLTIVDHKCGYKRKTSILSIIWHLLRQSLPNERRNNRRKIFL
jgi:hypothetical protein